MRKGMATFITIVMLMNLAISTGWCVSALGEDIVFNFDTAGTSTTATEYWRNYSTSITGLATSGGYLNGTARTTTPSLMQYVSSTQALCNADNYNTIVVGMKYTGIVPNSIPKMDYIRNVDGERPADSTTDTVNRRVFASALTETTSDQIVEVTFHMTDSALWAGSIKSVIFIPFDAVAGTSTFSIDYVKIKNISSYSVTYNANAGTDTVLNVPSTKTGIASGTTVTLDTSVPTRENYTFKGWAATADGTTPITTVTPTDSNVTVYAIWQVLPPLATEWNFTSADNSNWTVTNATGSIINGLFSIDSSSSNQAIFLSPTSLKLDAATYKTIKVGMAHKNSTNTTENSPKIMYKTSTTDWNVANSVTADKKFGGASSSDIVEYTFQMSTSASWSGMITQIEIPFEASGLYSIDYVRIFPSASDDTNVRLSFNIGTTATVITNAPYTISAQTGTSISLPDSSGFYKSGYTFKGWALTPNATEADVLTNVTMPAQNTVLYAVWAVKAVSGISAVISPANGSLNVFPKDLTIQYKFDTPMNESTLTPANFSSTYFQKVVYDANNFTATLYFKPDVVKYASSYTFTPSSAILSVDGTSFVSEPYTIQTTSIYENNGKNILTNGTAEDTNNVAFSQHTKGIIAEPGNTNNHVYSVGTSTVSSQVWVYTGQNTRFIPGRKYVIEYDVKIIGSNNGIAGAVTGIYTNVLYKGSSGTLENHTLQAGTFGSLDGWKHVKQEITISPLDTGRDADRFAIWVNPGIGYNYDYYVDNISMTPVPVVLFNGGTGAIGDAPTGFSGTYALGDKITLPANTYTKQNYTFVGWTSDAGITLQPGTSYTIAGSPVFTAKWKIMEGYGEYTASFQANGGTGTPPADITLIAQAGGSINKITFPSASTLSKNGYKFIGWGDSALSTVPTADEYLTSNKTYYAIWLLCSEWTFDSENNAEGWALSNAQNLTVTNGGLSFSVNNSKDPSISGSSFKIPAAEYGKIKIIYKSSIVNATNYSYPKLFFLNTINGVSTGGYAENRSFTGTEKLTSADTYTEFVIDTSKNSAWAGVITGLRFDPFDLTVSEESGPVVTIDSIKLIRNTAITEPINLTLDAPVTKTAPKAAMVATDAPYVVSRTVYSPTLENNLFSANTTYTATVTVSPKADYLFGNEYTVATFNGNSVPITRNDDGSLSVSYQFEPTQPLLDVAVVLTAPSTTITTDGGSLLMNAIVTSSGQINDSTVSFTIDSPTIASITANGTLTALKNGVVIVTATSNYDKTKSASITITILNQSASYTLTYNANAGTDTVTGLPPADGNAKGSTYPLVTTQPSRNGYRFIGWSTDTSGTTIATTVKVTANMQVYAVWAESPYGWEFATNSGGWVAGAQNGGFSVANGVLTTIGTGSDPTITVSSLDTMFPTLDLSQYGAVEITMAHDFTTATSSTLQLFFQTDAWSGDWAASSISANINSQSSNGKYIVYTLNGSENKYWTGTMKYFRLDPANAAGTFQIDSIRFIKTVFSVTFGQNSWLDTVTNMPSNSSNNTGILNTATLSTPIRVGYKFIGWGLTPDAVIPISCPYNLYKDTTLYALWQPGWYFKTVGQAEGWTTDSYTSVQACYGRLSGTYYGTAMTPKLISPSFC